MPHIKKIPNQTLKDLYISGLSCEKIADKVGMSRQAVHERLKRLKVSMRTKRLLKVLEYGGLKFTLNNLGYYRSTRRDKFISLHRYKYIQEIGQIPDNFDVHHIDLDKTNNDIDNLMAMDKADHTRLHHIISKTHPYNTAGYTFTVDVIAHILKGIL